MLNLYILSLQNLLKKIVDFPFYKKVTYIYFSIQFTKLVLVSNNKKLFKTFFT